MSNRWRLQAATLAALLLLGLGWPAETGNAASRGVAVTLPTFSVSLNGHAVNNRTRTYPLLVYRDITYFPMTWYDSRLLGLETSWSAQDGLSVTQAPVSGRYEPYASVERNAPQYTAQVVDGIVRVNGAAIDNAAEPYPLLRFRNVNYFPLTWRFAHDAFGWTYEWDDAAGLRIATNNPQVRETGLPAEAGDNGIALYRGSYYYVKTTGTVNRIYRLSAASPGTETEVYRYDADAIDGADTQVSFQQQDGWMRISYRVGYGNYDVTVNEEGELQQVYVKYRALLDFRETPYGRLIINTGVPDETNGNLHLIAADGAEHRIGDPSLTAFAQSALKDSRSPTTVIGDDAYVLLKHDYPSPYILYRINLVTNETAPIAEDLDWFAIEGNKLYYTRASDKVLYKAALDGSGALPLSDHPAVWFDAIGDHVFYTSLDDAGKLVLYRAEEAEDARLLTETVSGVTVRNGQLLAVPEDTAAKDAYVLDEQGEVLWQIGEPIAKVFASDDGWLVRSARDGRALLIR